MKTADTHIERSRQQYAYNRKLVFMATGLSLQEYNELVFESGIRFLEEHFPRYAEQEQLYILVSREKRFWTFWQFEWMKWENALIEWLKSNQMPLHRNLFVQESKYVHVNEALKDRFYKRYKTPKYNELQK